LREHQANIAAGAAAEKKTGFLPILQQTMQGVNQAIFKTIPEMTLETGAAASQALGKLATGQPLEANKMATEFITGMPAYAEHLYKQLSEGTPFEVGEAAPQAFGLMKGAAEIVPSMAKALPPLPTVSAPKFGSRLVNSIIKPTDAEFMFNRNPGGAVAKYGITDSTLEGLREKVAAKKWEVDTQAKGMLATAGDRMVDGSNAVKIVDDALAIALKKGDRAYYQRLQELKNQITKTFGVIEDEIQPTGYRYVHDTPEKINDLRREIAQDIKWRNLPYDPEINGIRGKVFQELSKAIEEKVPGVRELFRDESGLIAAESGLTRQINRAERSPIVLQRTIMGTLEQLANSVFGGDVRVKTKLASWLTRAKPEVQQWLAQEWNPYNLGLQEEQKFHPDIQAYKPGYGALFVGDKQMDLIGQAGKKDFSRVRGIRFEAPDIEAIRQNYLRLRTPVNRAVMELFDNVPKGEGVSLVKTPVTVDPTTGAMSLDKSLLEQTIRHETGHKNVNQIVGTKRGSWFNKDEFVKENPEAASLFTMPEGILSQAYTPSKMADEILANLASGRADFLGLTKTEGVQLLYSMLQYVEKRYGPQAPVKILENFAPKIQGLKGENWFLGGEKSFGEQAPGVAQEMRLPQWRKQVFGIPTVNDILSQIKSQGGITLSPSRAIRNYGEGFQVGIPGFEKRYALSKLTPSMLDDILTIYQKRASKVGGDIGAWVEGNNVVFDISKRVEVRDKAKAIAERNDQRAVYDWGTKEVINTPDLDMPINPSWYEKAENKIESLAAEYGVTKEQAAGVVAALSPLKSWETNLELAEEFLQLNKKGAQRSQFKGHFGGNVEKAYRILQGDDPRAVLGATGRGQKVMNFYEALTGNKEATVIDTHMANLLTGEGRIGLAAGKSPLAGLSKLQAKFMYDKLSERLKQQAEAAGVPVRDWQAQLWEDYKRMPIEEPAEQLPSWVTEEAAQIVPFPGSPTGESTSAAGRVLKFPESRESFSGGGKVVYGKGEGFIPEKRALWGQLRNPAMKISVKEARILRDHGVMVPTGPGFSRQQAIKFLEDQRPGVVQGLINFMGWDK
jgi:hypothetical protein